MSIVRFTAIAALLIGSINFLQAADTLELDAENSKIEFVGKKPDGKHSGGFKKFTAKAIADFEEPTNGLLEIEIDATSLFSDDEKLTNHLKNPDFFDVRKHPKINFKSTKLIVHEEQGKAKIVGDLTLLDRKIELEVPCTVSVDEKLVKVVANFELDRTKWGMTYGVGKISNDVEVKAHLVFKR